MTGSTMPSAAAFNVDPFRYSSVRPPRQCHAEQAMLPVILPRESGRNTGMERRSCFLRSWPMNHLHPAADGFCEASLDEKGVGGAKCCERSQQQAGEKGEHESDP